MKITPCKLVIAAVFMFVLAVNGLIPVCLGAGSFYMFIGAILWGFCNWMDTQMSQPRTIHEALGFENPWRCSVCDAKNEDTEDVCYHCGEERDVDE